MYTNYTIIENMPAAQLSMCVRVALKLKYHMTLYTLDAPIKIMHTH